MKLIVLSGFKLQVKKYFDFNDSDKVLETVKKLQTDIKNIIDDIREQDPDCMYTGYIQKYYSSNQYSIFLYIGYVLQEFYLKEDMPCFIPRIRKGDVDKKMNIRRVLKNGYLSEEFLKTYQSGTFMIKEDDEL